MTGNNTMTIKRIIPRRVGSWCLPYLQNRIREASQPLQDILTQVDLVKGYTFIYAPQGVAIEKHRPLEWAGVVPGRWKTPNIMELSEIPQKMLSRYLWNWLRKGGTIHQVPFSQARLILAEERLWQPGDPIVTGLSYSFVYRDTLYKWASSQDNAQWLQTLVEEVDLSYPPLLLCGIEWHKAICNVEDILSILEYGSEPEYAVKLIVMGVFDGESFLVWRACDEREQGNRTR
jgi:hypothetical protein